MRWWRTIFKDQPASAAPPAKLPARTAEFNRILERERTRADRTCRPLSMVLLGQAAKRPHPSRTSIIVESMRQRARVTDEVGLFDLHTGFAILPDTPIQGARRFVDEVARQLKLRQIETSFALYQYVPPASDFDDDSSGSTGRDSDQIRGVEVGKGVTVPSDTAAVYETANCLRHAFASGLPRWKRAADIVAASSGLLLTWPLLLTVGIAIKLDSPGPVIFKQQRAGLGGKPFAIWKFRTMRADAEHLRHTLLDINEQDGPAFKLKRDPRVTRIGGILRKTSLDELPQLINILTGDMTLVGPRPLPMLEAKACEAWQQRRLDVTPGLTCIWQVWGRSSVSFNEWVRMDLRYQRQRTPWHDLKIILATVPAVLRQRGAC